MSSTLTPRRLAGAAGALLCAAHAQAQVASAPATLDPVTVTASRIEQPLSSALGDVTVIDSDTIERAGQTSLAELLQREHGVDIATNGGPQTTTSVFLRGANSGQTIFLIDGQRVGGSTSGITGLGAISLAEVERIEILRGPASSLYGADAIGGVVNIITRRPTGDAPLQAHGSIGLGSWNTRKADAGLSGRQGGWRYALSAGYARSDGYSAAKPGEPGGAYNPDRDGYKLEHVAGRLGYAWREGQELEASFYRSRLNGQYDGGPAFDDRNVQRIESYALTSRNRISDAWASRLSVARTVDDSLSVYGPGEAGRAAFRTRQTLFSWQNDIALTPSQSLSLAAERRNEEVDSTTLFDQTNRITNSAVAIYRGDFGAHHVQGNVRYDHVARYGSRTTGGLSYGYDVAPGWQVTVAGNTGFRLPTFNDLYYPVYGNPDLRPETSRNIEAGLRYRRDGTEAGIVAYRNKIENLIQYQGYTQVANKNATIKGVTLSASQRLGATTLRGSFDWMDPRDDHTGEMLARRPRTALKLAAERQIGAWRLGAEWLARGHRMDTSYNSATFMNETTRLGGYSLINLVASYDINRNTQVQVRWNNVTDKDYELVRGYATPGSNVFVSLSYRP
ncbi:MAG: TonB-dependent receptor [Pigmentiphaga sp.]|uniref:TonB-dependent receptor domain-containing protein n=1 Tax=Pigmentiphaga sp. TaxID=1977564 RepID=UPI0029A2B31C|nr:TonB-dependent receptor [Pigmentiphaga sp.]MDX3906307.1 TonB-dependent receptor [Pigmentiphaga sp.]